MKKINLFLIILLLLALVSACFDSTGLGFQLLFFLAIILKLLLLFLYPYPTPFFKVYRIFITVLVVIFIFSFLPFGKKTNKGPNLPTVNGIKLSDCTKTLSDTPKMIPGWKVTIFSAPLIASGSSNLSEDNNVRTFSYSGIKNKTEANTMNIRFEKADGSYITSADTTIEVCNQNNKANYSYVTKYQGPRKSSGNDIVASINYFHGGAYLFGPGTYRVDAYIKEAGADWQLVDRLSDIKITE